MNWNYRILKNPIKDKKNYKVLTLFELNNLVDKDIEIIYFYKLNKCKYSKGKIIRAELNKLNEFYDFESNLTKKREKISMEVRFTSKKTEYIIDKTSIYFDFKKSFVAKYKEYPLYYRIINNKK